MPYFPDVNTYLHQSSLLIQAYPHTTRITTKYSLPRKSLDGKSTTVTTDTEATATDSPNTTTQRPKRDPSATLTLKTFHPESGICLKYQTDKAAEVGRLMTGLGRLAKREVIEMSSAAAGSADTTVGAGAGVEIGTGQALSGIGTEKMDIDSKPTAATSEAKTASQMTAGTPQQQQGGGGGGKKKKKGKK